MDFQSEKSFGKPRLCILKHVEDVEDRSHTTKGCNTMYVKDVKDYSNVK